MNKEVLKEKLNIKHIRTRKIDNRTNVGYIEGQHAIREANRAFDFDGWSYHISDMKLVSSEVKKGKKGGDLHYISYTCKATVQVGDTTRDGYGFGQGIARDLGMAHESAVKEAETDALKRALKSFGDIFGLALYDKTNSNITNAEKTISSSQIQELINLCDAKQLDMKEMAANWGMKAVSELYEENFKDFVEYLHKQ